MSINSALLAGVSGLTANASALAAISDNISNVNTTAYKRNQVNFTDIVTAQAVKGKYSAGGVQGTVHSYVSQQGLIQASNSSTDMAISGDGFFVVTQKGANLLPSDAREFTRAGAFTVDQDGFLKNNAGLYLQGWPVQAGGGFNIDPSDLTKMNSINVKNLGSAVTPTGNVGISANLDKGQTVQVAVSGAVGPPAVAPTYNLTTGSMAAYANSVATGTKPDFTIDMNVIDSTGGSRKVTLALLKDTTANTWNAEVYAPATDVTTTNGQLATGKIAFKQDGSIDFANTTLTGLTNYTDPVTGSQLGYTLAVNKSTGANPAWATSLGLAAQNINLDLTKLSQYAATSTVNSLTNDGAGVGNVVAINVDEAGIVTAVYDNNQIRKVAKVGVATFPNSDGLQQVSGNAYRSTIDAGQMVVKEAGVGGAGKISPSSLEASTVDLSSEFTGLIQTQKAYSASSKIITTADQMLDELINIIR